MAVSHLGRKGDRRKSNNRVALVDRSGRLAGSRAPRMPLPSCRAGVPLTTQRFDRRRSSMKWSTCVVSLLLGGLAAAAQDEPKKEGKAETVISLTDTPKAIADQIKSGSVVDIVIEEPAASPVRTVFVGNRVSAVTEDRRKKD